jgi:hypothetical protein
MGTAISPDHAGKRAATLKQTNWHIWGYSSSRRKHLTRRRLLMNLRVKAWQLPPRLITGAYFLNAGLSKRGADNATAGQLHGFAAGTYPFFGKLDAKRFTGLLSTAEIAIGTALVLPVVPAWLAGAGLTAFALGTMGLYLRTPGMRQEGSMRPTQQGIPLAKDAWMVGIGLALMVDEVAERARRS